MTADHPTPTGLLVENLLPSHPVSFMEHIGQGQRAHTPFP